MNQYSRNIVIVGFNDKDKEMLKFKDVREKKEEWQSLDYTHRFPYIIYVDTLEEGLKHQGFLLIVKMDVSNLEYVDYDIENRRKFKKYHMVYLYDENILRSFQIFSKRFHKIKILGEWNLTCDLKEDFLRKEYQAYIDDVNFENRITKKRKANIEKLYNYLKGKRSVTREEIMNDFKVSRKWVPRYMEDLYIIYQNIGCLVENKEWYITK